MRDKIFLALLDTQAAHWAKSREKFAKLKLSDAQPKVLYILRAVEGCVQKDLAAVCQIKPSTMAVLLTKMEKEGLIVRKAKCQSNGKRANEIFFTEKGRQISDELDRIIDELEEISLKGLSDEEKKMLFTLLERVTLNLK